MARRNRAANMPEHHGPELVTGDTNPGSPLRWTCRLGRCGGGLALSAPKLTGEQLVGMGEVAASAPRFLSAFSGISPHFRPRPPPAARRCLPPKMTSHFTTWNGAIGRHGQGGADACDTRDSLLRGGEYSFAAASSTRPTRNYCGRPVPSTGPPVEETYGARRPRLLRRPPMYDTLVGIDPVVVGGIVAFGAVVRLVALTIALRGASPGERPAIIRALAEFFHVLPRRRR